jgi:16S rRNA (cytidine1402-2'-O)-methyltransferase
MSARSAPSAAGVGTLYVVATPIGNLGDLSPRAREVLGSVQLIAAEDTRHTGQLLHGCGIATPLISLHEHNEARKVDQLVARLAAGESIALVSDAGTPLISDPGFALVAAARSASIAVVAIPGPCAAIAALSIAGLPANRFAFEGFLSPKTAARQRELELLVREPRTLIFYEAPHRLAETLDDMARVFGGERDAAVARELTKRFETVYAGNLAKLCERARDDPDMARGELVIVVAGAAADTDVRLAIDTERLLRALLEDMPPAQAAKIAARVSGEKRSDLYERAVRLGTKGRAEP